MTEPDKADTFAWRLWVDAPGYGKPGVRVRLYMQAEGDGEGAKLVLLADVMRWLMGEQGRALPLKAALAQLCDTLEKYEPEVFQASPDDAAQPLAGDALFGFDTELTWAARVLVEELDGPVFAPIRFDLYGRSYDLPAAHIDKRKLWQEVRYGLRPTRCPTDAEMARFKTPGLPAAIAYLRGHGARLFAPPPAHGKPPRYWKYDIQCLHLCVRLRTAQLLWGYGVASPASAAPAVAAPETWGELVAYRKANKGSPWLAEHVRIAKEEFAQRMKKATTTGKTTGIDTLMAKEIGISRQGLGRVLNGEGAGKREIKANKTADLLTFRRKTG